MADAARQRLAEFDSVLALEVQQRLLEMDSGRAAVTGRRRCVSGRPTESRRVVNERYMAGLISQTEALDAETDLLEAELDRTRAIANGPTRRGPARQGAGTMNAIEVRTVTRRFGAFVAVNDLTFDVRQGEIFGFLGQQRRRQIDDDPHAVRTAAAHRPARRGWAASTSAAIPKA